MVERALRIRPDQKILYITADRNSRNNVYMVRDRYSIRNTMVSQFLNKIANFLTDMGVDDVRVSSLYDALRREEPYKHRWIVRKIPIQEAHIDIEIYRSIRHDDDLIVIGNSISYPAVPR